MGAQTQCQERVHRTYKTSKRDRITLYQEQVKELAKEGKYSKTQNPHQVLANEKRHERVDRHCRLDDKENKKEVHFVKKRQIHTIKME
eukprot:6976893-Ditylum_brightwellii.AAC.1